MNRTSSWPEPLPPEDPWADVPSGDVPSGEGPRAALAARLHDVLTGRVPTPDPTLRDQAAALGLLGPLPHDERAFPPAPSLPSLADMARVAADFQPDRGDAPDHLLGPYFEQLDAAVPGHEAALRAALAASCFLALDADRSPFVDLCRRKPIPSVAVRAAFRAVDRTPLSLWGLRARVGDRWEVADRVGLAAPWVPRAPVALDDPGVVAGGPAVGDTLIARIVATEHGPVATTAFVVPGAPRDALVRSWLAVEALRARLTDPDVTLEGLLRERGHVLCRRVHEWAWGR